MMADGGPRAKKIRLSTEETSSSTDSLSDEREPYYYENFKMILDKVVSGCDKALLTQQEVDFADRFLSQTGPSQQLFVRLYLRKRRWLRANKLFYPEIAQDIVPILDELVKSGFLFDESQLTDINECLDLLQISELKTLCKQLNLPSSVLQKQKQLIIEALLKHCRQYKPIMSKLTSSELVVKRCKNLLGRCVIVSEVSSDVFSRISLLFSLPFTELDRKEVNNGLQTIIYHMLEAKIGRRTYPHYTVNVTKPIFQDRASFERYYSASQLEVQTLEILDLEAKKICEDSLNQITQTATEQLRFDIIQSQSRTKEETVIDLTVDGSCEETEVASPNAFLNEFSSGTVYTSILTQCSEGFEKLRKYSKANEILELLLSQEVFSKHKRGHWFERYTLNLEYHLGQKDKCLSVIKDALEDSTLHISKRLSLYQRASKILSQQCSKSSSKKHNMRKQLTIQDFNQVQLTLYKEVKISGQQHSTSCLFMTKDHVGSLTFLPVEGYAVHYYTSIEGWPKALHTEGSLFSSLFALLMWDVIFSSEVAEVFRSSYQTIPLDFGRESFYEHRKSMIDEELSQIKHSSIQDIAVNVQHAYEFHHGESCPLINWEKFGIEDIKELVCSLGPSLLFKVCELFSHNYYQNRGGLPDLTLWNAKEKSYKFVEVKGPGDRLSHKQMVWLSRLTDWGCEAEVCRVEGILIEEIILNVLESSSVKIKAIL